MADVGPTGPVQHEGLRTDGLQDARRRARRELRGLFVRTTAILVALTAAYYVWPARWNGDGPTALRVLGAVVGVALVAGVVRTQARAVREGTRAFAGAEALVTLLYLGVVLWASVYYALSGVPGSFAGMDTRTDALYFTVTVLSTVGFGDITATSAAARAVVTVQMIVGLLYIGTAVRVMSSLTTGTSSGRGGRPTGER